MTGNKRKIRDFLHAIVYFFPFQLLLAHIKRNHILLFFWVIPFGLVAQVFARKYGIPQLLLFPEYLGKVGFLSHVILGLSCGAFIMAFNMSSYIINGFRFPFIATLARPFLKYCLNNLVIPALFLALYVINMVEYQVNSELVSTSDLAIHLTGFALGNVLFIGISLVYFLSTNKSIFKFLKVPAMERSKTFRPIQDFLEPDLKWYQILNRKSEWKIETYLASPFSIRRARTTQHYKRETLKRVFQQNHLNASLFEIGAIASIFLLGWFMNISVFEIPAGASIFLLLAMILMFSGALHNWFKGWSIFGFIIIFLLLNQLSKQPGFRIHSQAFGLDYQNEQLYTNQHILENYSASIAESSYQEQLNRLNAIKNLNNGSRKLVLINCSGGGLRSAMWTFHVLQQTDSILKGKVLDHSVLITGASGGMIGAAYYRELNLRNKKLYDKKVVSSSFTKYPAKDILNRLSFSWVVNDLFIRFRKFSYENRTYDIDRGYFFEQKLLDNLEGVLDVPVSYYDQYVKSGETPDLWLTPTIANDGRPVLIASSTSQFLFRSTMKEYNRVPHLDFRTFFSDADADNLRFTSALRMNATFPYVLPNVTLPTKPQIEVMDAGIRDNYGTRWSVLYLNAMKEWIDEHIDEVLLLRIVDNVDSVKIQNDPHTSLVNSISKPVGSVYRNLFNYQRLDQQQILELIDDSLKNKLRVVNFKLDLKPEYEIPLSWHISVSDKQQIIKAINSVDNQNEMLRLKSFFEK